MPYYEEWVRHKRIRYRPSFLKYIHSMYHNIMIIDDISEQKEAHCPYYMQISFGGKLEYNLDNHKGIDKLEWSQCTLSADNHLEEEQQWGFRTISRSYESHYSLDKIVYWTNNQ